MRRIGIKIAFLPKTVAAIVQSLFGASIAEAGKLRFGGQTLRIKGNHTNEVARKRFAFAFSRLIRQAGRI